MSTKEQVKIFIKSLEEIVSDEEVFPKAFESVDNDSVDDYMLLGDWFDEGMKKLEEHMLSKVK